MPPGWDKSDDSDYRRRMNTAGVAPQDSTDAGAANPHERPHGPPDEPSAPPSLPHPRAAIPVPDLSDVDAADPGPVIASGSCADVYALTDDHVLRRYRSGRDAGAEVEILRHVVAHGFPAPAVFAALGPDLVMERLHGPSLLQALAAGEISLHDGAHIMANLHRRLHAIPVPESWQSPSSSGWGHATGGPSLVHLDLHPGNIVLSESRGPAVVDWANARTGTAELDVALSSVIMAEVAVDAGGDYSSAARALLVAFLSAADVEVLAALDDAVAIRRADPALIPGERELVPAAAQLVRDLVLVTR